MLNKAYWDLILKVIIYCVEEGSSSIPQSYTVASGADIKDLILLTVHYVQQELRYCYLLLTGPVLPDLGKRSQLFQPELTATWRTITATKFSPTATFTATFSAKSPSFYQ